MTLLELRTLLVRQSGRYDLVVNAIAYADAGADYYIMQAQRFLDRKLTTQFSKGHYRHKVLEGESVFLLPGFRVVNDVFLMTSGTKIELRKKSKKFLYQVYDGDTTPNITTRQPLYYTEVPVRTTTDQQKYGSNVVVNGTLDSATILTNWTWGAVLTASGNKINKNAAGVDTLTPVINSLFNTGRTYLVQAKVYRRSSSGTVTFTLGSAASYAFSQTGTVLQEIVADGAGLSIVFSTDFRGWLDDIVIREVHNEFGVDFDYGADIPMISAADYSPQIGITIYPTPEVTEGWNLVVDGLVYSAELVEDSDTSWWTEEHPQTLIDATRFMLERTRRNTTGRRDWQEVVLGDLKSIEDDLTEGEVAAFRTIENYDE